MEPNDSNPGRYRLIQPIGPTPYGVLHRGFHRELKADVMILVLDEMFREDDRAWESVLDAARLRHDHLVLVTDADRASGWIVMEERGKTFADVLREGRISANTVRTYMTHALYVLDYFEGEGHIHGDIRPGTVFLPAAPYAAARVKLGFSPGPSENGGYLLGEEAGKYVTPEMIDRHGTVTSASDLYSLAFSALELLIGKRFERFFRKEIPHENPWYIWHGSLDGFELTMRKFNPAIEDDFRRTLKMMLDKDPNRRPASARDAYNLLMTKEVRPFIFFSSVNRVEKTASSEQDAEDQPYGDEVIESSRIQPREPATGGWPTKEDLTDMNWWDARVKTPKGIAILCVLFLVPAILFGLAMQRKVSPNGPTVKPPPTEATAGAAPTATGETAPESAVKTGLRVEAAGLVYLEHEGQEIELKEDLNGLVPGEYHIILYDSENRNVLERSFSLKSGEIWQVKGTQLIAPE